MGMTKNLADIKADFDSHGLTINRPMRRSKPSKMDYILALQDHSIEEMRKAGTLTKGIEWIHGAMESPQLALSQTYYKTEEDFNALLKSEQFFCEEKFDGCRIVIFYSPEDGFEFFSRNRSVTDYLFSNHTGQIAYLENMQGVMNKSFALDSELISLNPSINGRIVTDTILNAVVSLLALKREDSYKAQEEAGFPLRFKCFDMMMLDGKNLFDAQTIKRKQYLSKFSNLLAQKSVTTGLTQLTWFEEAQYWEGGFEVKKAMYEKVTSQGGEGLILKNKNEYYNCREARTPGNWVKMKRSVSESVNPSGADIDAFISGFELGTVGKENEGKVGSLRLSVILTPSGDEHEIARCANIEQTLRDKMTVVIDGVPQLDPVWLRQVVTIDGQDISARAKRFTHARITSFRPEKNWFDCTFDEAQLNDLVL